MNQRRAPRLYMIITLCVCLLGTVLRAVCMLTQFDASIGYFDQGFLSITSCVLYFAAPVSAVVGAFFLPKSRIAPMPRTPYRAPLAYTLGTVFAAFSVFSFIDFRDVFFTRIGISQTALTLSALFAAAYFFVTALQHGTYRDTYVLLGFLPLLWCMSAISVTYSDPYVAMNSPIKVSLQMGLIGCMFILIAELGGRLGRPVSRKAQALTAIGTYFALTASLPLLAAAHVSPSRVYTLCAGVLLVVGLYGGYMLYCYTCHPITPKTVSDTASDTSDIPSEDPID